MLAFVNPPVNVTASPAPPAISVSTVVNVYVFVPIMMTEATTELLGTGEPGIGHFLTLCLALWAVFAAPSLR
jgi:hypothetical protein